MWANGDTYQQTEPEESQFQIDGEERLGHCNKTVNMKTLDDKLKIGVATGIFIFHNKNGQEIARAAKRWWIREKHWHRKGEMWRQSIRTHALSCDTK